MMSEDSMRVIFAMMLLIGFVKSADAASAKPIGGGAFPRVAVAPSRNSTPVRQFRAISANAPNRIASGQTIELVRRRISPPIINGTTLTNRRRFARF